MALSIDTQWNVRTDGSDTNGGGFVSGATGTDYSRQAAANSVGSNISTTDAVAAGTTTITSATAAFTTAITGNIIYLQGGSGSLTAGWYQATYVSATSITVDRTVASGTGITLNIGGGFLTVGRAATNVVSGNTIWVKSGTYTITTGINPGSNKTYALLGYGTTPGDNGTAPLITTSTNSITMYTVAGGGFNGFVHNVSFSSTAGTPGVGLLVSTGDGFPVQISNCTFTGFSIGIQGAAGPLMISDTYVSACTTIGISITGGDFVLADSTVSGTLSTNTNQPQVLFGTGAIGDGLIMRCLIVGGHSHGIYHNAGNGAVLRISSSTIANNLGDGLKMGTSWAIGNANGLSVVLRGNIFYGNGGWGANFPSNVPRAIFVGPNGWGSNTSGAYQNIPAGSGDQTLTATPFTNSGSGDYSLNSTAGGGALLKATGKPSSFLGGTTTSSPDMGAVQSSSSGGSSGTGNYGFIG